MAVGLPVVVSDVGGIPEVVTRETGITVPARNPAKLAESMKGLIEDQKKRIEMGRAASKRIQEEFSLRHFVSSTVDLYEHLMEKNPQKAD
jgi:glycosyltransferase involved in cell wall biosynthesis